MKQLESLVRQASTLGMDEPAGASADRELLAVGDLLAAPSKAPPLSAAAREVERVMHVCNACRYCEGFCAVFPAMTRRLQFNRADVHYLANLCHSCGACLHACQYAPPHEFAINVPGAMSQLRTETYEHYAWPPMLGALYRRNGLACAVAAATSLALFLVLAVALSGSLFRSGGVPGANFYAVIPHNTMVLLFGSVFGFALLALGMGCARFWREVSPAEPLASGRPGAVAEATADALRLKYLDGGHGEGCNEADDRYTLVRRRFHHLTFYGFLLCLASTSVATAYHYLLGYPAPYPVLSLPVLLGTVGGIGLVIGPAGLWWLSRRRHPLHGAASQRSLDRAFIALLFATSLSGLVLLAWRESAAMPLLLAVHLGIVMALFLTLPYGKFAHGIYRCAALLKFAIEKRMPSRLPTGKA